MLLRRSSAKYHQPTTATQSVTRTAATTTGIVALLFFRELVDGAAVVKGMPGTEVVDWGGSGGGGVGIAVVAMAGVGVEAAELAADVAAVVAAASVEAVVVEVAVAVLVSEVVVMVAVEEVVTDVVVVDAVVVVDVGVVVVVLVVSGHGVCSPVRTGVPLKLSKASAATVNPAGEEHSMATVDTRSAVPAE